MKFGMLGLFESLEGRSEKQMIDEQVSLMEAAEAYEFDSVWPAEHHFSEYGICGFPALNLAALARTTKRIRLGTGVVILPFHHPVRVAEDFAMLDQLSGGRVDLGIGRGCQPIEFNGFGVDQTQEKACEEFAKPVMWYFSTFGKYVATKVGQPPVESYEWYSTMRDSIMPSLR